MKPLSPREREIWRKQNIADLLSYAGLSFSEKLNLVQGAIEFARSIQGGKLPDSADEHDESGRLKTNR